MYDSVRGFAFFKHAFAMRILVTTAKTHDVGESDFFHQQLEARNTETTVTLDCEWSVGKKEKKKKKEQEEMDENSRFTNWSAWSLGLAWPGTTVER